VQDQGWKDEFSAALIGSCTNSSYEDMVTFLWCDDFYFAYFSQTSVASLARQAKAAGLVAKVSA
jgi:homoaconitase